LDKATALELLEFILESITLIKKRFSVIHSSDDFIKDAETIFMICDEKLDELEKKVQMLYQKINT
jgi:hypothetical protein